MLIPLMAGLTLSSMALIQAHKGSKGHESIAEAERAFSKRCGEVGIKKSFLENFHSRGVFFSPKPGFAADDLKNQPDDVLPLTTVLEWAPAVVDVSAAGDMGYTTGPLKIRAADDSRPPSFGQYFSVWIREKDTAPWKVILDFGTRTKTGGQEPRTIKYQAAPQAEPNSRPGASSNEINEAERRFADAAESALPSSVLRTHSDPNV
ncbi:MAG TPA: hypothetical protein PLX06_03240, partial [Fimbriimonadaceae bacterium]|nr:hypothetical protein [Fimbriimonadaceae bacterium]